MVIVSNVLAQDELILTSQAPIFSIKLDSAEFASRYDSLIEKWAALEQEMDSQGCLLFYYEYYKSKDKRLSERYGVITIRNQSAIDIFISRPYIKDIFSDKPIYIDSAFKSQRSFLVDKRTLKLISRLHGRKQFISQEVDKRSPWRRLLIIRKGQRLQVALYSNTGQPFDCKDCSNRKELREIYQWAFDPKVER